MEDRSNKWFMSLLFTRKTSIRILEVGLCKGDKLLEWYANDNGNQIVKKPAKVLSRAKFLLDHFLNVQIPILSKFQPDQVIAYLYHRKGRNIVRAKDVNDLSKYQLGGLQVRSIHMAPPGTFSPRIFRVKACDENTYLKQDIVSVHFCKAQETAVTDQNIREKAFNMTLIIAELLYKAKQEYVDRLIYDLAIDNNGQLFFIKLVSLKTIQTLMTLERNRFLLSRDVYTRKRKTVKMRPAIEEIPSRNTSNSQEKDKVPTRASSLAPKLKLSLSPRGEVNKDFLEMVAGTFEKERSRKIKNEKIKDKRFSMGGNENEPNIRLSPVPDIKTDHSKKENINNMKDLLSFIESTRNPNWSRDALYTQRSHRKSKTICKTPLLFSTYDSRQSDTFMLNNSPSSFRKLNYRAVSNIPICGCLTSSTSRASLLKQYMEEKEILYSYKYPDFDSKLSSPLKSPVSCASPVNFSTKKLNKYN
ncbi:unnamed protein product [Blepharisma stoltei]|uniref:CABIT domain-containing protein n=1 Tax=Blepharisma stoltei TaxID=1481888 RepID=A0AAU9JFI6_9CILI|nr:unnamed protein product [Blepharisma stoltei]